MLCLAGFNGLVWAFFGKRLEANSKLSPSLAVACPCVLEILLELNHSQRRVCSLARAAAMEKRTVPLSKNARVPDFSQSNFRIILTMPRATFLDIWKQKKHLDSMSDARIHRPSGCLIMKHHDQFGDVIMTWWREIGRRSLRESWRKKKWSGGRWCACCLVVVVRCLSQQSY